MNNLLAALYGLVSTNLNVIGFLLAQLLYGLLHVTGKPPVPTLNP